MGLIRILLAVCVFCAHTRPLANLPWTSGNLAVELFFVISGFYMQLILCTKYTEHNLGETWISQFYKARYFRLLPIYLAGYALVMGASLFYGDSFAPLSVWKAVSALPHSFANDTFKIFLSFTNLTLFFQDVVPFLSVHHEQVQWSVNYRNTDVDLWLGLAIPQAWSLGVEITFYLAAPFLLTLRSRWLVVGVFCSLIAKLIAITAFHLDDDPWNSRFFPFEIGYFLLGALAFRYTSRLNERGAGQFPTFPLYALAVGLVIFSAPSTFATFLYPAILACLLPSLFRATSTIRLDRYLGELSYPFYIFHVFAIQIGDSINRHLQFSSETAMWIGLALTLVLAAFGSALELRFIEPWRAQFAERRKEYKPVLQSIAATSQS